MSSSSGGGGGRLPVNLQKAWQLQRPTRDRSCPDLDVMMTMLTDIIIIAM
jgi:hypothetical protein